MKKYMKSQMLINKHKGESKMEINKSICPLCGKHNNCGYENGLTCLLYTSDAADE